MSVLASDKQVQQYADAVIRPFCELLVSLVTDANFVIGSFDDIYSALNQQSPTWADSNVNNYPHALTPSDILAINELLHTTLTAITGDANYAIALKARRQII